MWKTIDGDWLYHYRISDQAEIEKFKNGKWVKVKSQVHRHGRKNSVVLDCGLVAADGKRKTVLVKTLMANAFMGKRKPGQVVRSKNGMATDCALENLEYSTRAKLNKNGRSRKAVAKVDKKGEAIEFYRSVTEAAKKNNFALSTMSDYCRGILDPLARGEYSFIWAEQYEDERRKNGRWLRNAATKAP